MVVVSVVPSGSIARVLSGEVLLLLLTFVRRSFSMGTGI
jgi:hypothetical protein